MTVGYNSIMFFLNLAKRQHPVYIGHGVFINGNMLSEVRTNLAELKKAYGGVNLAYNSYEKAVSGVHDIFIPQQTVNGYEHGINLSVSVTKIKKLNHKKFVTITLQDYTRPTQLSS